MHRHATALLRALPFRAATMPFALKLLASALAGAAIALLLWPVHRQPPAPGRTSAPTRDLPAVGAVCQDGW